MRRLLRRFAKVFYDQVMTVLLALQETPDKPEALQCMPSLQLADIHARPTPSPRMWPASATPLC